MSGRPLSEVNLPQTPADEYFEELIAPYAGNVLYIDFRSIGCQPNRQEVVKIRECIEALKDRKIKFIYITSDADFPLEAYWQQFLEDFRGAGRAFAANEGPMEFIGFQIRDLWRALLCSCE